jgi:hypothetical protein
MLTQVGSRRTEKQPTGRGPEGWIENGPGPRFSAGSEKQMRLTAPEGRGQAEFSPLADTAWPAYPAREILKQLTASRNAQRQRASLSN